MTRRPGGRAAAAGALLVLACAGLSASAVDGQEAVSSTTLPWIGTADQSTRMMGAATAGAPGEVWAYEELPAGTTPPVVEGGRLGFAPGSGPQLAFLRFTDDTLWQVREVPLDRSGRPTRSIRPNRRSARITPRAGGVLVGRDTAAEPGREVTVLVRSGRRPFRAAPEPPPTVVRPADPPATPAAQPAEQLATEGGVGRVAVAAHDGENGTIVFAGVLGRETEDGVARFDAGDETWTREPIVDAEPGMQIAALDATGPGNAWLLGRVPPPEDDPGTDADEAAGGARILLFRRDADAREWRRVPLEAAPLTGAGAAAAGVRDLDVLADAGDPLTVTTDGVWVDGFFREGTAPAGGEDGPPVDVTLFRPVAAAGATTWCDAATGGLCDRPFGARFSRDSGYTSTAFPGPGFGSRIITNPLRPGGDEATNRGTYLRLDDGAFRRVSSTGGTFRVTSALSSPTRGWFEGPVELGGRPPQPDRFRSWPVTLRSPLNAITAAPVGGRAAIDAGALAAGSDGTIARYAPAQGWQREFLLSASGAVARPTLRGVAWPEPGRAHAVGDLGAMWLWRSDTNLWERDPAAPIGFEGNLMGVAFQPGASERGFAVGKDGTLLRYDKTWTQESLPAGFERANLGSVAFAGPQALVAAGRGLLVNDGGGWREDPGVRALLDGLGGGEPELLAVGGLPDGGAVAAGRNVVLERDGASAPWRLSDQPLLGATVIAAAAFREGGRVRALVSTVTRARYPIPDEPFIEDPESPTPIAPPFPLPPEGYVVRETGSGWRDESRTNLIGSVIDRPLKSDPVNALLVDDNGDGWAAAGWSGQSDASQRGSSARSAAGRADRGRVQTGAILRYRAGGGAPAAPGTAARPVQMPAGVATFAVAGHAQCESQCADQAAQLIGPDRLLTRAIDRARELAGQPGGPRMLLYTGGRLKPGLGASTPLEEMQRYAELLGSGGSLPIYPAVSAGDVQGDDGGDPAQRSASFRTAFASAALPAAFTGGGDGGGARTHYAFDSAAAGGAGTVRVIVIDNSRGSLEASDPHQNPPEPQRPWLVAQLAEARARGVASIVMGSRDLNTRFRPTLNVASDGDEVAALLVEGGASAYVFERPEENRTYPIPAGAPQQIPSFGVGTLGYRSPLAQTRGNDPDSTFGDPGILLLDLDTAKRDPATNRAPASPRLIPTFDDLTLQAVDGTLLRRSRPALFQALGRRPLAGDRWGAVSAGGSPSPPGGDPYVSLPPALCVSSTCSSRLLPVYRFESSDPAVGDFVRQDPASTNLRKPFLGTDDRVVTDNASGLFCAFNPGTTTVTVAAGGLSYTQKVTVLAGTAQRPCGTRPAPAREVQTPSASAAAPAPPPAPAPAPAPAPSPAPPPPPPPPPVPPAAAPPAPPAARAPAPPPVVPEPLFPLVPLSPVSVTGTPPTPPPPPAAGFGNPIPPGSVSVRVFEEKREEELAPEQSQAFTRYSADERSLPYGPTAIVGAVLLALAGASISSTRRRDRRRGVVAPVRLTPPPSNHRHRRHPR